MLDELDRRAEEKKRAYLREASYTLYLESEAGRVLEQRDNSGSSVDPRSAMFTALLANLTAAFRDTAARPVSWESASTLFGENVGLGRIGDDQPAAGGTLVINGGSLTMSADASSRVSTFTTAGTNWYGLASVGTTTTVAMDGALTVTTPLVPSLPPVWNSSPAATVSLVASNAGLVKQGAVASLPAATVTLAFNTNTLASSSVLNAAALASSTSLVRGTSAAPVDATTSSPASLTQAPGAVVPAGPKSTLYLASGDQHRNWRILAGTTTAIASSQANSNEYALSISGGVIRSAGNGQFGPPNVGSTYDLNFNYTGTQLGNPGNNVLDGTTDGVFNYGFDWQTREVYRYNLDWTSPVLLFTSNFTGSGFGITYSPANNSLWVSTNTGIVADYTLDGTFLSSFNDGTDNRALAYDNADGTLWALTNSGAGTLTQFNTAGTILQSFNVGTMGDNIFGGEFVEIPEPTGAALFGVGIMAMAGRRRHRKTSPAQV
jgi:hypothetical protein